MFAVIIVAVLAALLGIAVCFAGYRFFLVLLPIWGFFAGLFIGAQAVSLLFGTGFLADVTGLVVGIVVGIVVAVLSYLLYMLGVFVVAAGLGAALGGAAMAAIGLETGILNLAVSLVTAVVAGVLTLALNIQKYVIIVLTAMGGASLLLLSVLLIFGQVTIVDLQSGQNVIRPVLQGSWFWLIVWVVLAVLGLLVQIISNLNYTFTPDRYVEGWG